MSETVTSTRLCWRLTELPAVTGLSLAYWRKMRTQRRIPAQRIGGAVIVMHDDLVRYLTGLDTTNEETRTETLPTKDEVSIRAIA